MLTRLSASSIKSDALARIFDAATPLLIACIRNDKDLPKLLNELYTVAEYFQGRMDLYYALEDMFLYFRDKYGISGTSTFLILHKGKVLGTILGRNTTDALIMQSSDILLNNLDIIICEDQGVRASRGICIDKDEPEK